MTGLRVAVFFLALMLGAGVAQAADTRPAPSFRVSTLDGAAFETNRAMGRLFQPFLESVLEKCSVMVGVPVPPPDERPVQALLFAFPTATPVRLYLPTAGAASEAELDVLMVEVREGYFYADDVYFGRVVLSFSRPDADRETGRVVICSAPRVKRLLCHPALDVLKTRTCQIHRQAQDRINEQRRALDSWEMNVHPSARDGQESPVTE